jgi:hypothetical protein
MKYSPLAEKSDQDSQSSEDDEMQDSLLFSKHELGKAPISRKLVLLSAILIPLMSFFLLGLGIWVGRWSVNPNDICPSHVQKYCKFLQETCVKSELFLIWVQRPS